MSHGSGLSSSFFFAEENDGKCASKFKGKDEIFLACDS